MKKWMFLYFLAGALLLWGVVRYQAEKGLETAELLEQGQSCWLVNEQGGSYLLLGEEDRWRAVRTDGGRKEYCLLGAVSLDLVYYQYRYRDEKRRWIYGIAGYEQNGETVFSDIKQVEYDHCLAFGGEDGSLYYIKAEENGAFVREYRLLLSEEEGENKWYETQRIEPPEGHRVVGASYEKGIPSLCLENGEVYRYENGTASLLGEKPELVFSTKETTLPKGAREALQKAVMKSIWEEAALLYLGLFLFFGAILCGILWKGSPIRKIFCISTGVLAVVVLTGGALAGWRIQKELKRGSISQVAYLLERLWEKTEGENGMDSRSLSSAIKDSRDLLSEAALLDASVIPAKVVVAPWLPNGLSASTYYGDGLEELVAGSRRSLDTVTGEITREGYRNQVVLLQESEVEQQYVLMGILSERELATRLAEQIRTLLWIMGSLFAGGFVILSLAFAFWGIAWGRFSRAVTAVAIEKESYRMPDRLPGGLQGLWKSLAEIHRSLGETHYEKYQSLKAYSRFVPRKIEYILGKKGLGEVSAGDMEEVSGVMALLSLRSLKEPDGARYMELVTRSFQLMNRVLEEKRGILISQNADLAKRKLLFLERPESAVEFGIEAIHAYDRDPILKNVEYLVLLHSDRFMYGISGTEEQTVPFLYSRVERFLTPYIEPLCRAGLRLVLTEDLVEQLRSSYSFRYIGFVVKEDAGESIKLYEGLDAFPEPGRKVWLETEPEFRRALELFYSNDFYLARNTFNEVVKKNPEDRIARWYLFNCEYYLNTAGETEVAYGLFENRMLEQQYQSKLEVF